MLNPRVVLVAVSLMVSISATSSAHVSGIGEAFRFTLEPHVLSTVPLRGVQNHSAADSIRPVIFISSGGISKGAYQAGVNWAILSLLKRVNTDASMQHLNIGTSDLVVATGASAGNINTIFAAHEWANPDLAAAPPDSSLFWKFWMDVGLTEILPECRNPLLRRHKERDPAYEWCDLESFLSRYYLEQVLLQRVHSEIKDGKAARSLDVALGLTVTRLKPIDVYLSVQDSISVKSLRAAVVFRALGSADGNSRLQFVHHEATKADAYGIEPRAFGSLVHLDLEAGSPETDRLVFDAVMASAAFPYAWKPVPLTYYRSRGYNGAVANADTALFADGGAFDNNPVGLAFDLYDYEREIQSERSRRWSKPLALYVDPDDTRGPQPRPQQDQYTIPEDGLDATLSWLKEIVSSGRQYELEVVSRRLKPDHMAALRATDRRFPIVGDHLGAFGAFLARPFREYDFYVGVYDGYRFVARTLICNRSGTSDCVDEAVNELYDFSDLESRTANGARLFRLLQDLEHEPAGHECDHHPVRSASNHKSFILQHTLSALRTEQCEQTTFATPNAGRSTLGRFVRFVELLASDEIVASVDSLTACPITTPGIPGAGACDAAPHFKDLVKGGDPEDWVLGMLHTALIPATFLENKAGHDGHEKLPEGAHFFVNLARRRAHVGLTWSESTSVVAGDGIYGRGTYGPLKEMGRKIIKNAFPYEIELTTTGGYGLSWRPTLRVNRDFAFFVGLTPWKATRFYREGGDPLRISSSSAVSAGAEFAVSGVLDGDLRIRSGHPWDDSSGEIPSSYLDLGGGLIVGHFLRLGIDVPLNGLTSNTDVHRRLQFTVGIQDFGGMVYWLGRFSR